MAISIFKAHALEAIGRVAQSHESITITKRGKPVARVIPYASEEGNPVSGKLRSALIHEKDIVSPLGSGMWESSR